MTARQSISVEITLDAEIDATGEWNDYGVERSPRWFEYTPNDWAERTVYIAGVSVAIKSLPKELQSALWDAAMEGIDDNVWEQDEPDYY